MTAGAHVAEAAVIATCNRLEIYAEVDRFHGSVEEVSRLLVERAGEPTEAMLPHLYVHYEDGAVSHLFHVAAGLDSMAVGEGQILGQTRTALRTGQEHGTVGSALNVLFQQALRVGKRSRAETGIDQAAPTLVSEALQWLLPGGVAGLRVLVLGAGGMAALATATTARQGADDVVVVNRTPENAARLAAEYAVRSAPLGAFAEELAAADLLITCTGATGVLVGVDQVVAARPDQRPLAIADLALPHDVDPAVRDLPGVTLVGLADLADRLRDTAAGAGDRRRPPDRRRGGRGVPDRPPAGERHPDRRRAALDGHRRGRGRGGPAGLAAPRPRRRPSSREVKHSLRRIADKLLHQPTVRVRELANEAGAVVVRRRPRRAVLARPRRGRRRHPALGGGAVMTC